ncbi:hypothetical protein EPI10_030625 [Gossypium australe]|uniref:Uncharacterized protein n=1 Tax=Gossypium australe TaxID=47621 RepID=A0A5B6X1J1_9ROSI|nr:hypothetical protein EPI10_030625 [Gossypium australe]
MTSHTLGLLPTLVGRSKKEAFSHLYDRMRTKINIQANRYLSLGGKEKSATRKVCIGVVGLN